MVSGAEDRGPIFEPFDTKIEPRILKCIQIKRLTVNLLAQKEHKYGHWWVELNKFESYGWWPKYPLEELPGVVEPLIRTLAGVEGELNGVTSYMGSPTMDPHHGDEATYVFHPILIRPKTDFEVLEDIRIFAQAYAGEWRWTFGAGQNCHTFQKSMMASVGLVEP